MNEIDDRRICITDQPDGTALIWLPDVAYLDTQGGPVELGLDREIAEQLRDALDQWLIRKDHPMQGCNTSMACVMRNGCHRCRPTATVTNHTFEGTPGPGHPCQAKAFGETCGATWEQHELRDDCQHQDPNRLGHRPADLALICACGTEVFPGPATGGGMQPE